MTTALDQIVAAIIRHANDGDPVAQYRVGLLHELGHGVECNPREALRWYSAAAAQNIVEAHFAIGFLLESGRIEDADQAAACRWYSLAAAAGHCGARLRLCRMRADPRRRYPRADVARLSDIAAGARSSDTAASGAVIAPERTDRWHRVRIAAQQRPRAASVEPDTSGRAASFQ